MLKLKVFIGLNLKGSWGHVLVRLHYTKMYYMLLNCVLSYTCEDLFQISNIVTHFKNRFLKPNYILFCTYD